MTAGGSAADNDGMEPWIIALEAASPLADLVAAVAHDVSAGAPVRLTCDVDRRIALPGDAPLLRRLLEAVVCRAVAAAVAADPHSDLPPLREVVITAVDTGGGIEIEVADSGPARTDACGGEAAVLAARLGGTLTATACPEGGTALTLRLPRRRARGLAA